MNFQTVGIVAAVLLIAPGAATAETGDMQRPALVVRTYAIFEVSSDALRAARACAKAIFDIAGIDVSWVDCWRTKRDPVGVGPRCWQPLASNEVVLRILATGPAKGSRSGSMGFSLVNGTPGGEAPSFSTVFANLVTALARGAGVDARRVLGYVVAHEIGHLLLNNPHHPNAGLMRAMWSPVELRRDLAADWTFVSEEAETMRHALVAR